MVGLKSIFCEPSDLFSYGQCWFELKKIVLFFVGFFLMFFFLTRYKHLWSADYLWYTCVFLVTVQTGYAGNMNMNMGMGLLSPNNLMQIAQMVRSQVRCSIVLLQYTWISYTRTKFTLAVQIDILELHFGIGWFGCIVCFLSFFCVVGCCFFVWWGGGGGGRYCYVFVF